ncbi:MULTISPECIES: helix-turn-helix transcriptional regulator [unclassified Pseudomonas]|uniref:helix-turn-helix domain-containing protein n=1 Tax=unclassified Pseudomonas TaxID=196821 RepID=UPI002AC8FA5A|nr:MULTISPECIES: helix-turn-helix transcriptional regulator [unclassified Pseudomonas]MEB0048714.1 helix-turn-helix transcriptional regulator [Pseudomonas sp. Dout3]MEB0099535.1 helix-turn-helix transcriptional regulator [Pseudomonas sp. DC1.2]WPX60398.1 helix-turn-helix transcriptional regulator [Pseudomonas sp. DC1.2]
MPGIDHHQGLFWMSFTERFLRLRKQHSLTQQQMADTVGIHITQVKRYESGEAQPSLEVLKKVAVAFNVSTDWLVFEENEREPQDELKLKFEAVVQMDEDERRSVLALLDAMILKHQTKRFFVPSTESKQQP